MISACPGINEAHLNIDPAEEDAAKDPYYLEEAPVVLLALHSDVARVFKDHVIPVDIHCRPPAQNQAVDASELALHKMRV